MKQYRRVSMLRILFCGLLAALSATGALADTKTWVGTGTSAWDISSNWNPTGIPAAGDEVRIVTADVGVLLTNEVGYFDSLLLSNTVTLIFSNWNTSLSATNITIATDARMTCVGPFIDGAMSNRVYLVCSNLTVASGGQIDVSARGYAGGRGAVYAAGNGPGVGWAGSAYGGKSSYVFPYGTATNAEFAGSGGYNGAAAEAGYSGGDGGGAVWIQASGLVTINGLINANAGVAGYYYWFSGYCGGTGGGIHISCDRFAGATGRVEARGSFGDAAGDHGSGGRIAIQYNPTAQSSLPSPTTTFDCRRGYNASYGFPTITNSEAGTVYFTDSRFLGDLINNNLLNGQVVLGVSNWATDRLTISNCWVGFTRDDFQLTVSNNITVAGSDGRLEIGGATYALCGYVAGNSTFVKRFSGTSQPVICVGGNLVFTNGATFHVYSGISPATPTNYGALVNVRGDLALYEQASLYIEACPTNSGWPFFQMNNLLVASNASIRADYAGYAGGLVGAGGYGPGGGSNIYAGGSYGGRGGGSSAATYGNSNAPADGGSGGSSINSWSSYRGGTGGGFVHLDAQNSITLNGIVSANGWNGHYGGCAAGAGGGVYIKCKRLGGVGGVIQTIGGAVLRADNSDVGAGGGGRIAIWRVDDNSSGISANASGGVNAYNALNNGATGTVVFGWSPRVGTIITLR